MTCRNTPREVLRIESSFDCNSARDHLLILSLTPLMCFACQGCVFYTKVLTSSHTARILELARNTMFRASFLYNKRMELAIKTVITIFIIGGGTYLNEWLKNDLLSAWNEIWIVAVIAVLAAILVLLVDWFSSVLIKSFQKPKIEVVTTRKEDEINISIETKGAVERLSVNYPVLGVVTNFNDLNSLTDARTMLTKVVGDDSQNDVQNNVQISVTDIKKNAKLQYKIFCTPTPINIEIGGTDRYELVYTWQYKAEKIQEEEWRNIEDDGLTSRPNIHVMGTKVFDRVLTPEEMKEMYEAGPPQQNI